MTIPCLNPVAMIDFHQVAVSVHPSGLSNPSVGRSMNRIAVAGSNIQPFMIGRPYAARADTETEMTGNHTAYRPDIRGNRTSRRSGNTKACRHNRTGQISHRCTSQINHFLNLMIQLIIQCHHFIEQLPRSMHPGGNRVVLCRIGRYIRYGTGTALPILQRILSSRSLGQIAIHHALHLF